MRTPLQAFLARPVELQMVDVGPPDNEIKGRPGLVFEHCLHRGTSLYYSRIEDAGIRCCNHGGMFDFQGNCVKQPAELGGGRARQKYRQPWYPVQEQYGLVWAYVGPPEKTHAATGEGL